METEMHVIPLKNGLWRVVNVSAIPERIEGAAWLSPEMFQLWSIAYRLWWATKGRRLAISPEMWME